MVEVQTGNAEDYEQYRKALNKATKTVRKFKAALQRLPHAMGRLKVENNFLPLASSRGHGASVIGQPEGGEVKLNFSFVAKNYFYFFPERCSHKK